MPRPASFGRSQRRSTTPGKSLCREWSEPGRAQPETCILTPALPGDANLDGTVDINDLTVVLSHYGQTGMTWSQGEFTGDGTVDINDLTIVLAHYGQSAERRPRHGAGAGAVVPGSARHRRRRTAGLRLAGAKRTM